MIIDQICVISRLNRPQSSDHDAVARVSGLSGNPGRSSYPSPWEPLETMLPHPLRPNTNPPTPRFKPDIRKYCPPPPHTYIRISLAILSPMFRLCKCNYCREIFHSRGRALTFQVTNAHPGTQSKSFAPKVDQFEESRFLVINISASIDGDALSLCVPQW